MNIQGNRKDDLLEDALSDSFFEFREDNCSDVALYKNLEWEMRSPRYTQLVDRGKIKYGFEEHAERLKEQGWRRAPSAREYLSLILYYELGMMDNNLRSLVEDIEGWEFTCNIVNVDSNTLNVHDCRIIFPSEDSHVIAGASFKHRSINLQGLAGYIYGEELPISVLRDKCPELYDSFYMKRFAKVMAKKDPYIILPKEGRNWLLTVNRDGSIKPADEAYSRGVKQL
ncbi:hypothetical protein KY330_00065 [Candidatus Woesearchaeota archaeon]|nr:hypothetical protein [Candidatus Woesearchaeota archaeon]